MANQKISDLTLATAFASGDLLEIETAGGASRKITQDTLTELMRDTIAAALVAGTNVTITNNDAGDTITIAAAGSGGGGSSVARHPGYASGRAYPSGPFTQTNAAVSTAVMQAIPLILAEPATITDLGVQVVTGIAGANGKLAIYDNNTSLHIPGNKLAEVAITPTASAALASATLGTPLALAAGVYWVVCQFDQAVTLVVTGITDGMLPWLIGTTNGNWTRQDNTINYAQAFSAGLPNTYPTTGYNTGNGSCPKISFKVA